MPDAPREVYVRGRERCVGAVAAGEARSIAIGRARLLCFALLVAAGWGAWDGVVPGATITIPIIGFIALVFVHEREHQRIDRARRGVAHYDDGLARLDGTWVGRGNARTDLVAADHPYARDLDLFGRGSIFELLCTARTAAGEQTLAAWLSSPADLHALAERRAAVEELAPSVVLREELASLGEALRAEVDPDALARWGEATAVVGARTRSRIAVGAWVIPPCVAATGALWSGGVLPAWPLVVALAGLFAFHRWARPFTVAGAAIERPARELATVAGLLARLESEAVSAPRLRALQAALVRGEASASRRIRTLCRLFEWLQVRQSQLLAIVAWLVCWTEHFTLAIERWRQRSGGDIARWFAALGELEALAALSAHAFEQPGDVWPELVDGAPTLEATAIAHPLLPRDTAVANDVALGGTTVALMISGSNMAGKSTYMRTVGVNVVLALAGAKVRASRMRLSVLQVAASIRIEDSLRDGASRFYAEISRLKQVTVLAAGPTPVLFLLDEVLHGTNSHDRRVGARAVLGLLLDAGALGMMTTHDLALATDVEGLAPRVRNVHFCDTLRDDRLVFDHRLREGIVETSNALALMRAVGLRV